MVCTVIEGRCILNASVIEMLNEKQAAQYLGCSVGMMCKGRLFGNGPAFSKLRRLVRYSEADLAPVVEANRVGGN